MSGVAVLGDVARRSGGALAEMYARLAGKWGPDLIENQNRVGQVFSELAKHPNYALSPREIVRGSDSSKAVQLANKYNLGKFVSDPEERLLMHPLGSSIGETGDTPMSLAKALDGIPSNSPRRQAAIDNIRFSKLANMGPHDPFMNIDMMGADEGAGLAGKLYPAMIEYMMSHPGSAALTTGLTPSNMQKRGMYQSMMMEKNGSLARNRIQTDPTQLDANWGAAKNATDFMKRDTPGQIGAFNTIIGNNTQAKLQALMEAANKQVVAHDQGPWAPTTDQIRATNRLYESIDKAKRLGLSEASWLSPTDNFQGISDVVGDLAHQLDVSRPVGVDSMRRAAITNEILKNPELRAEDLYGSPITAGLAKAKGGRVQAPRTQSGPLSQCSCGAK